MRPARYKYGITQILLKRSKTCTRPHHGDVHRVAVGVAENSHRLHAHTLGGAHDTHGDLAAVGNDKLADGRLGDRASCGGVAAQRRQPRDTSRKHDGQIMARSLPCERPSITRVKMKTNS